MLNVIASIAIYGKQIEVWLKASQQPEKNE
jgi:hypothetical protein